MKRSARKVMGGDSSDWVEGFGFLAWSIVPVFGVQALSEASEIGSDEMIVTVLVSRLFKSAALPTLTQLKRVEADTANFSPHVQRSMKLYFAIAEARIGDHRTAMGLLEESNSGDRQSIRHEVQLDSLRRYRGIDLSPVLGKLANRSGPMLLAIHKQKRDYRPFICLRPKDSGTY